MSEIPQESQSSGLGVNDVLFVFFKHKFKILFWTFAGLLGAAFACYQHTPLYQSDAKLLVRYVVDKSAIDPESAAGASANRFLDNVINSEVEILTSWDLAVQVVETIGPEKLLGGGKVGGDASLAGARKIMSGLTVTPGKGSNVIMVSYKDSDPQMAALVLNELITHYFTKHLEVHRSAGASEFVADQTVKVDNELRETEESLQNLKGSANIASLSDAMTTVRAAIAKCQADLFSAETDRVAQEARVNALRKISGSETAAAADPKDAAKKAGATASAEISETPATTSESQQYEAVVTQLTHLRATKLDLQSRYTESNPMVKNNQREIDELEAIRRAMEKKHPSFLARNTSESTSVAGPVGLSELAAQAAILTGMTAKVNALTNELTELKKQSDNLTHVAPAIEKLDRKKEVQEANYKYFSEVGEKARIDETLSAMDPTKIPNISEVEKPTPAFRVTSDLKKTLLALVLGGLALGLGSAIFIEVMVDHTLRRPLELETRLQIPLLLSIPFISEGKRVKKLKGAKDALALPGGGKANVAPWDASHFIRPFSEALRDRLDMYFHVNNVTHKPKLIGVTGQSEHAGASTLAAGLAASLSEPGDGKVLLVDMNLRHAEVHPFFQGRPACSLSTALEPDSPIASAADNLYLATAVSMGNGEANVGLKRLSAMVPTLLASDFDYVIFDLPPVGQTSPTSAMAALMDKVLLVVEAEKCPRDSVKRAYSELTSARANVSVIFNKARSYGPKWINGAV